MRWTLSIAWASIEAFHQALHSQMALPLVRETPAPQAWREHMMKRGPSSSVSKSVMAWIRSWAFILPSIRVRRRMAIAFECHMSNEEMFGYRSTTDDNIPVLAETSLRQSFMWCQDKIELVLVDLLENVLTILAMVDSNLELIWLNSFQFVDPTSWQWRRRAKQSRCNKVLPRPSRGDSRESNKWTATSAWR
jgi:hypothetical protein